MAEKVDRPINVFPAKQRDCENSIFVASIVHTRFMTALVIFFVTLVYYYTRTCAQMVHSLALFVLAGSINGCLHSDACVSLRSIPFCRNKHDIIAHQLWSLIEAGRRIRG